MKNPSKRITWKEISRQKFLMVCAAIFFVYGIVFYYVPLAGWGNGLSELQTQRRLLLSIRRTGKV